MGCKKREILDELIYFPWIPFKLQIPASTTYPVHGASITFPYWKKYSWVKMNWKSEPIFGSTLLVLYNCLILDKETGFHLQKINKVQLTTAVKVLNVGRPPITQFHIVCQPVSTCKYSQDLNLATVFERIEPKNK